APLPAGADPQLSCFVRGRGRRSRRPGCADQPAPGDGRGRARRSQTGAGTVPGGAAGMRSGRRQHPGSAPGGNPGQGAAECAPGAGAAGAVRARTGRPA
ncbi:hypothetical protein B8W90_11300, partial [Staphylococcus hominis]